METAGNANEINAVCLKLDSLFDLRLTAQINGTGLHFEKLLHATDLISGSHYYVLQISSEIILFNKTAELYGGLIRVIEKELNKIRDEINNCQSKLATDVESDKARIHSQLAELGHREDKLYKIIGQIEEYPGVK